MEELVCVMVASSGETIFSGYVLVLDGQEVKKSSSPAIGSFASLPGKVRTAIIDTANGNRISSVKASGVTYDIFAVVCE